MKFFNTILLLVGIFITVSISHSAFASSNSTNLSNYDQILEWYDGGTQILVENMVGYWSGRCFNRDNPNQPMGALLATAVYKEKSSGPGLPNIEEVHGMVVTDANPTFADNMPLDVAQSYIVNRLGALPQAIQSDDHVSWQFRNFLLGFKQHDKYIVSDIENLMINPGYDRSVTDCYFFQKIVGQK